MDSFGWERLYFGCFFSVTGSFEWLFSSGKNHIARRIIGGM
jgi:hypothetical protein